MPRRIDQQSLDAIASRHVLSGTQSLLDNTLATVSHRKKMESESQLQQLRSQQIQQQGAEMAEYQKQAHLRDLTNQVAAQEKQFALDNREQMQENKLYADSVGRLQNEVSAKNSITEKLLAQTDTNSFQATLEENKGVYSDEFYNTYKDVNWSNTTERSAATERMISDIKFEQDKRLQQIKASTTSTIKLPKASFNADNAIMSLTASGMKPEHAAVTVDVLRGITDTYREDGLQVTYSDVNDAATQLIKLNKSKYMLEEGGMPLTGWYAEETINKPALEADIKAYMETGGLVPDGAVWQQLQRDNPNYSAQELLQAISQQR